MNKKVILTIESVYTANAFRIGNEFYVAAGSETKPDVYLYNVASDRSSFVTGCPGGVMSFVPVPGKPDLFFSIMGLFPPFIGAEAGVFMHRRSGENWETIKAMDLPFAHRCEILTRNGKNYLFAVSVSQHKENPADWSKTGEVYAVQLENDIKLPLKPLLIDNSVIRNHGMLRTKIEGVETLCISGAEGIFSFNLSTEGNWSMHQVFDKEVSEFSFIDLNGDGQDELVTIEPFHGETLNIYKRVGKKWELMFSDSLSFGHGLSSGFINHEPLIVVGNRRGSFSLDLFKVADGKKGEFERVVLEEDAGPTQTQVFTAGNTDYILSANQKKNEVALYY